MFKYLIVCMHLYIIIIPVIMMFAMFYFYIAT